MTRHGLLWLVIIIGIFLFSPLIVNQKEYAECFRKEIAIAADFYGPEEVSSILQSAQRIYDFGMVKTGIDKGIQTMNTPLPEKKEMITSAPVPKYLEPWADRIGGYWAGLLDNIFLFTLRLAHMWLWMGYLVPFLAAIFFDGVMVRKAKIASFRYTSPTIYNLSWHVIIAIVCLSFVAFAVTTPISVFAYPIGISVIGILIRMLLSNVQHSA